MQTLQKNFDLLDAGDKAMVESVLKAIENLPPATQLKTIRPMLTTNPKYKDQIAKIISLAGESKSAGVGAKAIAWLKEAVNQAKLRAEYGRVAAIEEELEKSSNVTLKLNDPKYRLKFITKENGEIEDLQVRIPVKEVGQTVEFWAQAKEALEGFNTKVMEIMRASNIIGEKTERLPGKLERDADGQWVIRLPERKPAQPKDPNAPAASRGNKGSTWDLVFGEGTDAEQVIVPDLASRAKGVNAWAKHVRANNILDKSGKQIATAKDETGPSFNFPRSYAPKFAATGFTLREKVAAPATNGETKPEEVKAEAQA